MDILSTTIMLNLFYYVFFGCLVIVTLVATVALVARLTGYATADIVDFLKVIKYRKEVLIIPDETDITNAEY